jgi:anthranilate synthase component 1
MDVLPDRSTFTAAYDAGQAQVLWAELPADLYTPVSVMLKIGQEQPFTALLESIQGGAVRERYSFIALQPDLVWRCKGQKAEICTKPGALPLAYQPDDKPTLTSLRALMAASRMKLPDHLPPMAAGLIGYMSYDTIRLVENIPSKNPDTLGVPDGMFMRPTLTVIFDSVKDMMTIVAAVYPASGVSAQAAYEAAEKRIHGLVSTLGKAAPHDTPAASPRFDAATSNIGRDGYHRMVNKAKEYILAGDIFQVVPSAALPPAVHASVLRAVPRVAAPEPLAVPVPPQSRRLRHRRLEPGDSRAPARRQGDDPPHRRHPSARQEQAGGRSAGRRPFV